MDDISYTPEEIAKILKISRFTVYELVKRGELTAYRIGRKMRIEAPDLAVYIKKSKGTSPAPTLSPIAPASFPEQEGLIICGQDIVLDILTRRLEREVPHARFLRNYIGSIDGLLALYRGSANVVTAHLWDSDADTYNIPYVRRLLPGHKTLIINLAYRMEGFYVTKGNPLSIRTWSDLTRPGLRFVNRERGSGARVLLDEHLRLLAIDHAAVAGYDHEEMSHLAVAGYVARGLADVGLGIEKAALQVADIGFIPLQKERYDIVIRQEDMSKPHFQALFQVLRSAEFQDEIAGLGGYDVSETGKILAET
ncbi:helix-turn-helix transcriptional regulator [Acetonema longum]|uniref:Uncharacterized protein n=1 Tax=Acetonema longum DSM 6540 TaxID=1009370 RepID=F7NG87_9FIRM|nr:helix-turn-helix transcriptional regulator [Acetonema longum]EGO65005.1 hypothetical protein ALO_05368 [Acetonema longum DSM 6540]